MKRKVKRERRGWQWLTLPHRHQCSTISACGLNFRVRDGTGCTPTALTTNTPFSHLLCFRSYSSHTLSTPARAPGSPYHDRKPSTISTGQLHTLLRFHPPPIQLVVSQRSYSLFRMGNLVLGGASHLDAFSGYPTRSSLPSDAAGATTGTRALRPPRSSRTRGSSPQIPNAHSG